MKGAFFVFKPHGVFVVMYARITKKLIDEHPDYFKGAKKPYPMMIRSYISKTMYDDLPVPVPEFNHFMKQIPGNHFPFETPTAKLVAHLDLVRPSSKKQYSAAYFETAKEGIRKTLASV